MIDWKPYRSCLNVVVVQREEGHIQPVFFSMKPVSLWSSESLVVLNCADELEESTLLS